MNAIGMSSFGEAEVLQLQEFPALRVTQGCVRVAIHAAALNRADLLQRRGLYPPPQGDSAILGLEMAGVVTEMAPDVSNVRIGDRVMALLAGGGYAEEAIVPADMLMPIPQALSFEEAAAIPEVYLTAYSNLVWLGRIQPGARVLIHAGASGVGTAAIQLVRNMGGTSFVTAGSDAKCAFCEQLGAAKAVNYKDGPFVQDVLAWSEQQGVDILFDFIGAPYLEQNLQCLHTDGRLVIIGTMGGATAEKVELGLLLRKRLQILGTALRSRSLEQKVALTKEFAAFALPRFADGSLRSIVDRTFALSDAAAAHRYMEGNHNTGKIVLKVRD